MLNTITQSIANYRKAKQAMGKAYIEIGQAADRLYSRGGIVCELEARTGERFVFTPTDLSIKLQNASDNKLKLYTINRKPRIVITLNLLRLEDPSYLGELIAEYDKQATATQVDFLSRNLKGAKMEVKKWTKKMSEYQQRMENMNVVP